MNHLIFDSFRKCLKRDCRLAFYLSVLSQPTDKLYPNLPLPNKHFQYESPIYSGFFLLKIISFLL